MKNTLFILLALVMVNPAWAQLFREKKSPDERRAEIREERSQIIKKIAEKKPEIAKKIKTAPGYATFSALNVNLLVVASARGKGVVMDNESGAETFMSVMSLGGGVGAGLKDMRALLIFNDAATMREFVNSGWTFGAKADATAKAGDEGAEFGESVNVSANENGTAMDTGLSSGAGDVLQANTAIEIYRITETGVALQATIAGTKFSKTDELND